MIKASKNRLFEILFSFYNTGLLRKHFYRIFLSGEKNLLPLLKNNTVILYANHSNWWDGLAAFYLSKTIWNIDAYVMMDIEQMQKYIFFKRVGAFSVNRSNAKEALESVEYAVDLLRNHRRVLWIFPQGKMQHNDFRPIVFFNGISKIAQKLNDVTLIPVALRYEFLMEQRPEIFISIGKAKSTGLSGNARDLTAELNGELLKELDQLKNRVVNSEFGGFRTILQGRESVNKRVDTVKRR